MTNTGWQLHGEKPWEGRTTEMDQAKPRKPWPLILVAGALAFAVVAGLVFWFTRPPVLPTVIESVVTVTPAEVTVTATPTPTPEPDPTTQAEPEPPAPVQPPVVQPPVVQPPVVEPAPPATQAPNGGPPVIHAVSCNRVGQNFTSDVSFNASGLAGSVTISIGPVVLPHSFSAGTTSAQAFATISSHAQTCTATVTTSHGSATLSATSN